MPQSILEVSVCCSSHPRDTGACCHVERCTAACKHISALEHWPAGAFLTNPNIGLLMALILADLPQGLSLHVSKNMCSTAGQRDGENHILTICAFHPHSKSDRPLNFIQWCSFHAGGLCRVDTSLPV